MAHTVFISYATKDKPVADGICASLEAAGIRCWIPPRDIAPGEDWPTAISKAISHSRAMVLVYSASSNSSENVSRELVLAANSKLVIIPFKIENIEPEPGKQYYLARTHWIEAVNPPTQGQIQALVESILACVRPDLPMAEYASDSAPEAYPEMVAPADLPSSRKPGWFRKWFSRLPGDSSTDAPPPEGKRKPKG